MKRLWSPGNLSDQAIIDKKTGKVYNLTLNLRNYFNLIKRIISKSAPCH